MGFHQVTFELVFGEYSDTLDDICDEYERCRDTSNSQLAALHTVMQVHGKLLHCRASRVEEICDVCYKLSIQARRNLRTPTTFILARTGRLTRIFRKLFTHLHAHFSCGIRMRFVSLFLCIALVFRDGELCFV